MSPSVSDDQDNCPHKCMWRALQDVALPAVLIVGVIAVFTTIIWLF